MPIDVTVFVNNLISTSPNISANVKKGVSSATALFAAAQTGGINVSDLSNLNTSDIRQKLSGLSATTQLDTARLGTSTAATTVTAKSDNLGPEQAQEETFSKGANRSLLNEDNAPIGTPLIKVNDDIPILLQNEVKALMVQIAFMETSYNTEYDSGKYAGRYAVHTNTLEAYGYKSKGEWTGKDGITGLTDFIFDSKVQDKIMEKFIKDQYNALIKVGAIKAGDSKQTVAGLIATSYQFQDANPLSSSDLSSLTSSLTNIGSLASGAITAGQTQVSGSNSVLDSSNSMKEIGNQLQEKLNDPSLNDTINKLSGALRTGAGSDPTAAAAAVSITNIQQTISKTNLSAENLKSSVADTFSESQSSKLSSVLTNATDTAKLAASKVNISSIQAGASDFFSSLPANKTKAWRINGKEKDSQGRPGSLFYNAGRYAVQSLAADKG